MLNQFLKRLKQARSTPPAPPVQETLVPRIKHLNFLKALEAHGVPREQWPVTTPLCGELLVSYAFDQPEQFVFATPPLLQQAGIAMDQLPHLAQQNLAREMPQPQLLRQHGYISVQTGGDLEATLLVLDRFWDQLSASEDADFVVVVPRRECLLLCDARDAQACQRISTEASHGLRQQPDVHALSQQRMVRRQGRWVLFEGG